MGSELLGLHPNAVGRSEDIDSAWAGRPLTWCHPQQPRGLRRRAQLQDRVVEQVTVVRGQLLPFAPNTVRLRKHISRALTGVAVNGGGECAHNKRRVRKCYPVTEFVPRQAVACG